MDHPKVVSDEYGTLRPGASAWGDFLYDAFYGGAIGGSVVALVSLMIDAIRFEPLFTPSLLGSVLFLGADPEAVIGVRMTMVAGFTIVHLVVFAVLGLVISALVQRLHELALHPFAVSTVVFVTLHGGFLVADAVLLQGVMEVLGFWWIALVNATAGVAMGLFLLQAHRDAETIRGPTTRSLSTAEEEA